LPALKKPTSDQALSNVTESNPIERMEVLTGKKKSNSKEKLIGLQHSSLKLLVDYFIKRKIITDRK